MTAALTSRPAAPASATPGAPRAMASSNPLNVRLIGLVFDADFLVARILMPPSGGRVLLDAIGCRNVPSGYVAEAGAFLSHPLATLESSPDARFSLPLVGFTWGLIRVLLGLCPLVRRERVKEDGR